MIDRSSSATVRAFLTGSIASVTSTIALALAAKAERKGALQPINATSHWLHGPEAAAVTRADLTHTAVGYATHHTATIFWAALFDMRPRSQETAPRVIRNAAAMAAIAAGVDYLATPKRFTPGWELVLTKRSMAWTYVALAAGLALGVAASDRSGRRS